MLDYIFNIGLFFLAIYLILTVFVLIKEKISQKSKHGHE